MPVKVKPSRLLGYCPDGGIGIAPFDRIFDSSVCIDRPGALEKIDCLLLFGGSDIHPSYYRETQGRYTGVDAWPSKRDEFEYRAMLFCKIHDIPMIGLCRGGQFLTILAGGSLIQHVSNHNGANHPIETSDGRHLNTNSVHHQMMNPYKVPHTLLAWASPSQSRIYLNGDDQEVEGFEKQKEPEIIYYPEIRGLAIQGHPEYGSAPHAFKDLCVEYAAEYLFNEKVLESAK